MHVMERGGGEYYSYGCEMLICMMIIEGDRAIDWHSQCVEWRISGEELEIWFRKKEIKEFRALLCIV
jgi:hypothetical protein